MNGLVGSTATTADAEARRAIGEDQALDQGGLPRPGRAGDPDATGPAEGAVDPREQPLESRPAVLDHRDRPRQRGRLAGREVREQKIRIHGSKVAPRRGRGKRMGRPQAVAGCNRWRAASRA